MESRSTPSNTEELYTLFDTIYLAKVKPFIEINLPRNKYTEPVYYILDNFKIRRFRAALPLLLAEHYRLPEKEIVPLAAASELMFAIALVQDDFFDRSTIRGIITSAHIKYTPEVAMASSDYCYTYVMKFFYSLENSSISPITLKKIYALFIDIQEKVFESFLIELLHNAKLDFEEKDVLRLHYLKTIHGVNTLYATCLICDELQGTNIAIKIREYSELLALAGQIKNDIYDLTRYAKTRGLTDLLNGYLNYPLAKLIRLLSEEEKIKLKKSFKEKKTEDILQLMEEKKIISLCTTDCLLYAEKAKIIIETEFTGEIKNILLLWVEGNKINTASVS